MCQGRIDFCGVGFTNDGGHTVGLDSKSLFTYVCLFIGSITSPIDFIITTVSSQVWLTQASPNWYHNTLYDRHYKTNN